MVSTSPMVWAVGMFIPRGGSSCGTADSGLRHVLKPMWLNSARRRENWDTLRNSPPSPTSPRADMLSGKGVF